MPCLLRQGQAHIPRLHLDSKVTVFAHRYKLEDEQKKDSEEYKSLGAKFGLYHGLSSFANLGALIGSFVYAWELASMLP